VLTRTNRNSDPTTFEYNSGCACPSSPSNIIHPGGAEENFTYNQFGQVTVSIDTLSNATSYTYDRSGRPISVSSPDGQRTTNSYTGQYLTRQVTKLNATENRTTDLLYDAAGNITRVTDANGGVTMFT
jgi:YD repeat-containing protein